MRLLHLKIRLCRPAPCDPFCPLIPKSPQFHHKGVRRSTALWMLSATVNIISSGAMCTIMIPSTETIFYSKPLKAESCWWTGKVWTTQDWNISLQACLLLQILRHSLSCSLACLNLQFLPLKCGTHLYFLTVRPEPQTLPAFARWCCNRIAHVSMWTLLRPSSDDKKHKRRGFVRRTRLQRGPRAAQTPPQGLLAHPGSRMVSVKNFSNHF